MGIATNAAARPRAVIEGRSFVASVHFLRRTTWIDNVSTDQMLVLEGLTLSQSGYMLAANAQQAVGLAHE